LRHNLRALIVKFKEVTERTLATVREVKAAAQKDGLLDVYRAAAKREQDLIDTLNAMEADAANDVE